MEEHIPTINQEPQHFNTVPYQQQDTTTLQNVPDPSETATQQNVSELSDISMNNPESLTITNDSNILRTPVHKITQNPVNDHNRNGTTHNLNQDNTSTLSTSNTHILNNFKHKKPLLEIMNHLFFLHKNVLKVLHIILLHKVLLIHKSQIQYNSKQLPQQHNQLYKP